MEMTNTMFRTFSPWHMEYAELIVRSLRAGETYTAEAIDHAVRSLHPRLSCQPQSIRAALVYARARGWVHHAGSGKNARGRTCQLWRLP